MAEPEGRREPFLAIPCNSFPEIRLYVCGGGCRLDGQFPWMWQECEQRQANNSTHLSNTTQMSSPDLCTSIAEYIVQTVRRAGQIL